MGGYTFGYSDFSRITLCGKALSRRFADRHTISGKFCSRRNCMLRKKWISLLVAISMVAAMFPSTVFADTVETTEPVEP